MAFFAISFALIAGLCASFAFGSGLIALFPHESAQGRFENQTFRNTGNTNTYFAPATCQAWAEYPGSRIDGFVVIITGRVRVGGGIGVISSLVHGDKGSPVLRRHDSFSRK